MKSNKRKNKINEILKVTLVIIFFTSLYGCSNKNEANEKNFLDALKEHYKESTLCIEEATPLKILNLNKVPSFQRDFLGQLAKDPTSNFGRIISLEKAGLIFKANENADTYQLTKLGQKYSRETTIRRPFQEQKSGLKFCWGKIIPSEVLNWDIPNSNSASQRTIVTYKYQIGELASWAQNKSIQASYPKIGSVIEMQNSKEIKQVLKLTNNGWQAIE